MIPDKNIAFKGSDCLLCLFHSDVVFRNEGSADGMGAVDRNSDACACDLQIRQMQNLSAFILHLHLFCCIAVVKIGTDLGDAVERDLCREYGVCDRLVVHDGIDLIIQLSEAADAGPADCLVCTCLDLCDRTDLRDRG